MLIYKADNRDYDFNFKLIFLTGLVIGCIALSRQWVFLISSISNFIISISNKIKYLIFWSSSAFLGFLISSWFYLVFIKYGSFTAFNMQSWFFTMNQAHTFYFPNLSQLQYLFSKPIRPHLDNQFFSIIYSDLWGDYWGYFIFTSRFLDIGRNQPNIGDYLARVNLISIVTTIVLVSFCYLTYRNYKSNFIIKYINLAIIISIVGYFLFTIIYPTSTGDTIKATYIIQVFHLMAFIGSIYLNDLKKTSNKTYKIVLLTLVMIYFHNFQTYLSHYPFNFLP